MSALITIIGILSSFFVAYISIELVPAIPTGKLSEMLKEEQSAPLKGWRKGLSALDKPVAKWAPGAFLRKTRTDLYWAHLGGVWLDWNAVQFTSLRLAAAVAGFGLGMFATSSLLFCLVGAYAGFQLPAMKMRSIARRTRRTFLAQLPEYVQLVSAQMAAGVSLEEALRRTSKGASLAAGWTRGVLQMAQGRDLVGQMQREARDSGLAELIGMSVQMEFIRRGSAQKELMGQLAASIAADYIGSAEQRAERIGAELVIPMVLFYFLPFMLTLLVVIGWPIVAGMGAW